MIDRRRTVLRADKAGVNAGQAERSGGTAFRQEAATVQMKFVCGQWGCSDWHGLTATGRPSAKAAFHHLRPQSTSEKHFCNGSMLLKKGS
jgi:hypothetical protein